MMRAVTEVGGAVTEDLLPVADFLLPRETAADFVEPRNAAKIASWIPETCHLAAVAARIALDWLAVTEVTDFLHNVELAHGLTPQGLWGHAKYVKIPEGLFTVKSLLLLLPPQLGSKNTAVCQ
jgi:hypothetical protein